MIQAYNSHPTGSEQNAAVLRGLRVAVTGGTSGLGLALVRTLAGRGARVAFIARDGTRVERVAAATGTHGIAGDVSVKTAIHPIALQILGLLGGLDVLINNASSLGPAALRPLADTDCEDLELAFATNVLGPFRLTKALLGALVASAREGTGAVVLNISSDAAINAYPGWGAYGASKAALHHMSAIWQEELNSAPLALRAFPPSGSEPSFGRPGGRLIGFRFLSLDPGDMDTPLHAQAVPDADPSTLKRPEGAAAALVCSIAMALADLNGTNAAAPSINHGSDVASRSS